MCPGAYEEDLAWQHSGHDVRMLLLRLDAILIAVEFACVPPPA